MCDVLIPAYINRELLVGPCNYFAIVESYREGPAGYYSIGLLILFEPVPRVLAFAMAIDRETLLIVQFLRLIDRDGICQSQLVVHNESSIFSPPTAEHSTTWLPA